MSIKVDYLQTEIDNLSIIYQDIEFVIRRLKESDLPVTSLYEAQHALDMAMDRLDALLEEAEDFDD